MQNLLWFAFLIFHFTLLLRLAVSVSLVKV